MHPQTTTHEPELGVERARVSYRCYLKYRLQRYQFTGANQGRIAVQDRVPHFAFIVQIVLSNTNERVQILDLKRVPRFWYPQHCLQLRILSI